MNNDNYQHAVDILKSGGVIAYPTEAVYGIGCDPDNEAALLKVVQLKNRDIHKGMLLVAASFEQLLPYIDLKSLPKEKLAVAYATWPGPYTWILPASTALNAMITGHRQTVGVRVSAFAPVVQLCNQFGKPIVSTSANLSTNKAVRTYEDVQQIFGNQLDYILPGQVQGLAKPTAIKDIFTEERLR